MGYSVVSVWTDSGEIEIRELVCNCDYKIIEEVDEFVSVTTDEIESVTCDKCGREFVPRFMMHISVIEKDEDEGKQVSEFVLSAEEDDELTLSYESSVSGNVKQIDVEVTNVTDGMITMTDGEYEYRVHSSESMRNREAGVVERDGRKIGMFVS